MNSFSKAERKDLSNPESFPGPGAYSKDEDSTRNKAKFSKKRSNFSKSIKNSSYIDDQMKETPGPGKYFINEKFYKRR